jgi:hypothetical protein
VVKSFCLCRGSNLDRPVVQPVVRHYTDLPGLPNKDVSNGYLGTDTISIPEQIISTSSIIKESSGECRRIQYLIHFYILCINKESLCQINNTTIQMTTLPRWRGYLTLHFTDFHKYRAKTKFPSIIFSYIYIYIVTYSGSSIHDGSLLHSKIQYTTLDYSS